MYHTPKKGSKIITRQIMKIFGLEIWKYRYRELFAEITAFLSDSSQDRGKAIFTPNPEICLRTLEDREFLDVLQNADYLTSDGIGLYLAYQMQDASKIGALVLFPYFLFNILFRKKYLYAKYGDRICGSDLTNDLLIFSEENNIQIAIIDPYYPADKDKCASQETFRAKLSAKFPSLDFDFYVYSGEKSDEIFQKIHASWAQILFSTLGMKSQEISVLKWLKLCQNLRLWLWIGSSFDYHIWFQKRAPEIFRTLGFEWLYRIFTSPNTCKRLARIYQALIVFPIKILLHK